MPPAALPTAIAHYRIDGVLGQGGMGIVYLGHDTHLCRPVAIKVLSPDRIDRVSRDNFHAEALLLSSLNHPNIATVFDFGSERDVDYLVMELVPGQTVYDLVKSGAVSKGRIAALGAQLMRGLAAAHAAGVIHRDVKPRNLCVTARGLLKILDFGVATSPAVCLTEDTTGSCARSMPALAGTLKYMAPEQLRGTPANARTDIFSAGIVLYEMACGLVSGSREHPAQLIEAARSRPLSWARRVIPGISRALERVVLRALANDPARRYQRAEEAAADLETIAMA